jgi:hypothetical protein
MSARPIDPERSRIILIGAPEYDDLQLPDVPVVTNNIADLAAAFTDPLIGGFDALHCITASPRASVAEIGDLLVQAASEAEDLLLFYYSGHGLLGTRSHELYLSLAGTRPGQVQFTALAFAAVREACLDSRAASRVVILDSCFSGRAIGETLGTDEILGQVEVKGTYTLTSAPANSTALVLPGERHTAFTERLLRLLHEGSPQAGAMLTLGDIYRHLHALLRAESLPAPQQRGTETADLLGLVRNRFAPDTVGHAPARPEIPEPVTTRASHLTAASGSRATATPQPSPMPAWNIPPIIPPRIPPQVITVWGAPASGKTTFLAALNMAVQSMDGGWNITALNDQSAEMLAGLTAELVGKGKFPLATAYPAGYLLMLQGQVRTTGRRRFRKDPQPQQLQIPLEVVELPDQTMAPVRDQLIDQMLRSRGILFMLDPRREFEVGDAYERITGVCSRLGREMINHTGNGKLPHYLAVCITKFDERQVLDAAQKLDLLTADPSDSSSSPRVKDDDARKFLQYLCEASHSRSGDIVVTALEQYFRPERIKYFVTSAVGFYIDPSSRVFNLNDPQNVINGGTSQSIHVRGRVRPINVAEPLLWLTRQFIENMETGRN